MRLLVFPVDGTAVSRVASSEGVYWTWIMNAYCNRADGSGLDDDRSDGRERRNEGKATGEDDHSAGTDKRTGNMIKDVRTIQSQGE